MYPYDCFVTVGDKFLVSEIQQPIVICFSIILTFNGSCVIVLQCISATTIINCNSNVFLLAYRLYSSLSAHTYIIYNYNYIYI